MKSQNNIIYNENYLTKEKINTNWYSNQLQLVLDAMRRETLDKQNALTELHERNIELEAMSADRNRILAELQRVRKFSPEGLPSFLKPLAKIPLLLSVAGPLEPIRMFKKRKIEQKLQKRKPVPAEEGASIHIITLIYNSERFIESYFKALSKIAFEKDRVFIHLLDNASSDNSYQIAKTYLEKNDFPFEVSLEQSESNLGFTGGNNHVFKKVLQSDPNGFSFLLNIDSEIDPECIQKCFDCIIEDPATGMVEAKQDPKEHPKWYDPESLITDWCSCGGVLIRHRALQEVGIFDNRFFLYCEDVDLSWRMWLGGWRCKINPEATYTHCTEEQDEEKDQSTRFYHSLRNNFLMHAKYSTRIENKEFEKFYCEQMEYHKGTPQYDLMRKALVDGKSLGSRSDRKIQNLLPEHPAISFHGMDYGRRRRFRDTEDGQRVFF